MPACLSCGCLNCSRTEEHHKHSADKPHPSFAIPTLVFRSEHRRHSTLQGRLPPLALAPAEEREEEEEEERNRRWKQGGGEEPQSANREGRSQDREREKKA
ncbi:hypothetical protein LZ31DRAFT_548397 [Colletotrichum somersetense]|nr:hypothetical protein LZ31DRAFT_548397 [Colletotrichum somersetense]